MLVFSFCHKDSFLVRRKDETANILYWVYVTSDVSQGCEMP